MAALVDQTVEVYRGQAIRLNFTMSPVEDITTWALMFSVTDAPDKVKKFIGPLAMAIVNGPAGTFRIDLTEDHLNIKAASYRFDVWRTDEGLEDPKAMGDFIVYGSSGVPPTWLP